MSAAAKTETVRGRTLSGIFLWTARTTSLAVVLLLVAAFTDGPLPLGKEWAYVAMFPMAFCAAYLLGWRWPRLGGYLSLACMGISLVVVGRVFDRNAYIAWGLMCIPAVLYLVGGGLKARA